MSDEARLNEIAAENIYLVPAWAETSTAIPIRDEETRLLRDEMGIPIFTEE